MCETRFECVVGMHPDYYDVNFIVKKDERTEVSHPLTVLLQFTIHGEIHIVLIFYITIEDYLL